MKIFTNQQIRGIEQYTVEHDNVTTNDLIERAATAITCEIMSRWRPNKPIWVFAGQGNNGADALSASRMLIEQG